MKYVPLFGITAKEPRSEQRSTSTESHSNHEEPSTAHHAESHSDQRRTTTESHSTPAEKPQTTAQGEPRSTHRGQPREPCSELDDQPSTSPRALFRGTTSPATENQPPCWRQALPVADATAAQRNPFRTSTKRVRFQDHVEETPEPSPPLCGTVNSVSHPTKDQVSFQTKEPETQDFPEPWVKEFLDQELAKFDTLSGVSHIAEHRVFMRTDQPLKQRQPPSARLPQGTTSHALHRFRPHRGQPDDGRTRPSADSRPGATGHCMEVRCGRRAPTGAPRRRPSQPLPSDSLADPFRPRALPVEDITIDADDMASQHTSPSGPRPLPLEVAHHRGDDEEGCPGTSAPLGHNDSIQKSPTVATVAGSSPLQGRAPATTSRSRSPPPSYEEIFGPGPYAGPHITARCAAVTPSRDPRPGLPTIAELAAEEARRRAEDVSEELGNPPVAQPPTNGPPSPTPRRRARRRSAPRADSPPSSSDESSSDADEGALNPPRWAPAPVEWTTPNGTLPAALLRRIHGRLAVPRRRTIRILEEEANQRFRVQINRSGKVIVTLHPSRR
nr:nascent polypeptide-associated complex subunit alpha, muscle-specific form-like [Drosophila kikkawai]